MTFSPLFEYYLYHLGNPINPGESHWRDPLPMSRQGAWKNSPMVSVSVGGYFLGARAFLEKGGLRPLTFSLSRQAGREIRPEEIEAVRICLAKHGEFYHPARVEVLVSGSSFFLVLNVALSEAGRSCAKREFLLLEKLKEAFSCRLVPEVYCREEGSLEGESPTEMFLGEWFEGFHEFHLSRDPSDGRIKIGVWDPKGCFYLGPDPSRAVYRKAAEILTGYYRADTFEQIFPWHHAAGDFVVRCGGSLDPELRLVTVRQYAPMVESEGADSDSTLQGLLIFFLNLSIRMRLDRLDGVGDIVWAEEQAVSATLEGFLSALCQSPTASFLPEQPSAFFRDFLLQSDPAGLLDLASAIVDSCNPESPDLPVIRRNLGRHIAELVRALHG